MFDSNQSEMWPELQRLAQRLPDACEKVTAKLAKYRGINTPRQVVHGDARPEHFLVDGGELTGLIDFETLRYDSPLADLTRLAGEVAIGDAGRRDDVVAAYEAITGEAIDRCFVAALDLASAAISAGNWLTWVRDSSMIHRRHPELIRQRLVAILARLGSD